MSHFLSDARFALRLLRRQPGINGLAMLTLAVGCAAGATVFTAIHSLLLRELPVHQPQALVRMAIIGGRGNRVRTAFSFAEFVRASETGEAVEGWLATETLAATVRTSLGVEQILSGEIVSGNYFTLLGVPVSAGRGFTDAEMLPNARSRVVMVSDALWRSALHADPQTIGRTIQLNGTPFTVIGVVGAPFRGTNFAAAHDLWIPFGARGQLRGDDDRPPHWSEDRSQRTLQLIGRLKPGAAISRLNADLSRIGANDSNPVPLFDNAKVVALPERAGLIAPGMPESVTLITGVAGALIVVTILVVAMNLAAVFLARGVARQRELAMRSALGAARSRIYGQLLAESTIMAVPAIALALLLTLWSGAVYRAFMPPLSTGLTIDFDPDLTVALVTIACGLSAAVGATLLTASRVVNRDVFLTLRGNQSGTVAENRVFGWLIGVQFAMCALTLVGAGFVIANMMNYQRVDTGVDVTRTLVASVNEPSEVGDRESFEEQVVAAVTQLPGVRRVSLATHLPLSPSSAHLTLGRDLLRLEEVGVNYVTATYFEAMSLRVIEGRALSRSDDARSDVVVINQRLARELPAPVIGQSIRFIENGHVAQVVGVVGDVKYECLACPARPYVFLPFTRSMDARVTVHAQVDGNPSDFVNPVRNALERVTGPRQIPDVKTVAAIVDADLWLSRSSALVVSGLALLIGLLAAVGLYGLTAFRIQRSLRTLAIQAALGARRLDMWRFVARQGLSASAAGGVLGLLLGYVGVAALAGVVLGVSPSDPNIYLIVVSTLLATAGCAVAIPARRAMRQDLVNVLKDS